MNYTNLQPEDFLRLVLLDLAFVTASYVSDEMRALEERFWITAAGNACFSTGRKIVNEKLVYKVTNRLVEEHVVFGQ